MNRASIRMRTPEARLAGRLFDGDKIVKPMLGSRAIDLYEASKDEWAWNSRYWEQRALLVADSDLPTALQYAKHAVAIEIHSFTLTTLGKLLFRKMEGLEASARTPAFSEAFGTLTRAIEMEGYKSRITVHPFATLLGGTLRFFQLGGTLPAECYEKLITHMDNAGYYFRKDPQIMTTLPQLDDFMSST